ncbi:glutamate [NMDA] receptor subunit 1 [Hyalella azteca]|uniref:Glutamate [NMDA] receptor subunit 1 n=1 Tax=Hyalella azteca TaxID=294128 RepID=A0A979FX73_HYAAZ|nr:glutamate [NMDA] receptor subunit 1 [Hyalella azteca]
MCGENMTSYQAPNITTKLDGLNQEGHDIHEAYVNLQENVEFDSDDNVELVSDEYVELDSDDNVEFNSDEYATDDECTTSVDYAVATYDDDTVSVADVARAFVIGGVVRDDVTSEFFLNEISEANFRGSTSSSHVTLYGVTLLEARSPLVVARDVCRHLISQNVAVIIAAGGSNSSAPTASISYTGGFYHIPVLSISVRDSAFSNKNLHASLLRTVPPYSHQAAVWLRLLERFSFRSVVFVMSSEAEGWTTLRHLHDLVRDMSDETNVKVSEGDDMRVKVSEGDDMRVKVSEVDDMRVKVSEGDDMKVKVSEGDDMRVKVSEGDDMRVKVSSTVEFAPGSASVLNELRPLQNSTVRVYLLATRHVTAKALKSLQEEQPEMITSPPSACCQENHWNITGPLLYRYLKRQDLTEGLTGRVAFDNNGDRIFAEYEIINALQDNLLKVVGTYLYNKSSGRMDLELNEEIVWPGGVSETPTGYFIPAHLKVLTLEDKPFLMMSETSVEKSECVTPTHAPCLLYAGAAVIPGERCCSGYCVHLLNELASASNFTFDLYVSNDTEYGEQYYSNGTGRLTNFQLTETQDVSKSDKKCTIVPAIVSIVQPFHESLWAILLASVHVVALCVWLLDHFSPMYKNSGSETDSLTLSEACWLSWGVLLNSGMNEGTPRSLSARVLTLIWAGFAMILLASYTANLAAFLVLEEHTDAITGINDPKLRNPSENFTFGTVVGSAVDTYFRQKIELSNMYRVMNRSNVRSAQEGINALLNGTLKAFIWDSSRLEYEASRNCELVTVGDIFGRSGYGIALVRGSPWAEKITLDILHFHESGLMAKLDDQWIWSDLEDECPLEVDGEPLQLGLTNIEGMFYMVVGATITGTILIFIEIFCKRINIKKAAQERAGSRPPFAGKTNCKEEEGEADFLDEVVDEFPIPEAVMYGQQGRQNCSRNLDQDKRCTSNEKDHKQTSAPCNSIKSTNKSLQKIGHRLKNSTNLPWICTNWSEAEWIGYYLHRIDKEIQEKSATKCTSNLSPLLKSKQTLLKMRSAARRHELQVSDHSSDGVACSVTGLTPILISKPVDDVQKQKANVSSVEVQLHNPHMEIAQGPKERSSKNSNVNFIKRSNCASRDICSTVEAVCEHSPIDALGTAFDKEAHQGVKCKMSRKPIQSQPVAFHVDKLPDVVGAVSNLEINNGYENISQAVNV